jgi:hypothetical protein
MQNLPTPVRNDVPVPLSADNEVTDICIRHNFDPAYEIINLDKEIRQAMDEEIIKPSDAFKLRLDAYKTMMGYRYNSKKPIAQEIAGDAVTNVMVVNYADVETIMTQKAVQKAGLDDDL